MFFCCPSWLVTVMSDAAVKSPPVVIAVTVNVSPSPSFNSVTSGIAIQVTGDTSVSLLDVILYGGLPPLIWNVTFSVTLATVDPACISNLALAGQIN